MAKPEREVHDDSADEFSPEIRRILAVPEIKRLVETIRRNIGLAMINGEQHTTQSFRRAEDLRDAFAGKLQKLDDTAVSPLVAEAKKRYADVIKEYGIKDGDLINLFKKVWIYSRLKNPGIELLEEAISVMEGTEATAVFGSGLAAINAVIEQFISHARKGANGEYVKGGKIVVIGAIYGGTYAQMQHTFKATGRQFVHLPISRFLQEGLPEDTEMVFFETSNNPSLRVSPIGRIVEEAKRVGAITVCDNTFTPLTVKPAELGVDLTVHSMTKYIGGKSEDLGGSVSGRTELISRLSGLHEGERMVRGGVLAPRVAKEFLQNMKDMPERLFNAAKNARALKTLAQRYNLNARITEDDKNFAEIKNPRMPAELGNGMVNIDFGTAEAARAFVNEMVEKGIGKCAVSLGAATTYYSIPAETTHSEMPAEEQRKAGIKPGMVRISCGTEKNLAERVGEVIKSVLGMNRRHNASSFSSGFKGSFFDLSGQPQQKSA